MNGINNANPAGSWGFRIANYATTAVAYTFTVPMTKFALGRLLSSTWAAPLAGTAAAAASPLVVPVVVSVVAPYAAAGMVKIAEKTVALTKEALIKREYRNLDPAKVREIDTEDGTLLEEVPAGEVDMEDFEHLEGGFKVFAEEVLEAFEIVDRDVDQT